MTNQCTSTYKEIELLRGQGYTWEELIPEIAIRWETTEYKVMIMVNYYRDVNE